MALASVDMAIGLAFASAWLRTPVDKGATA
jgi:hypothetical protein